MTTVPILGRGNSKVGRVWTFSLPALVTCPGASPWCPTHCYALRLQRLRPQCHAAYLRNLDLTRNPRAFVRTMLKALPQDLECLRLHVSGDLYTRTYIEALHDICAARPCVQFWGYSRSWNVATLRPALERLRTLANVQLFASVDATMPVPPSNWRAAYVADDSRANGLPCRQQHGQETSCLACGYCFRRQEGDVVFQIH